MKNTIPNDRSEIRVPILILGGAAAICCGAPLFIIAGGSALMAGVTGYWLFGFFLAIPAALSILGIGLWYGLRRDHRARNLSNSGMEDHDSLGIERLNNTKT